MGISLEKPIIAYKGYSGLKDGSYTTTTIYSFINRYEKQIEAVNQFLNKAKDKVKMLFIGVAQGEEALTHLQTAENIALKKGKKLANVVDLTLVEAACPIEINYKKAKDAHISQSCIDFLKELYQDKTKTHFETPFEKFIPKQIKKGEKQDIVFFNNVLQHVDFGKNEENSAKILQSIEDMIDSINDEGLFCFSVEKFILAKYPNTQKYYNIVLEMLNKKGFREISQGVFQKQKVSNIEIDNAQKAQALYRLN